MRGVLVPTLLAVAALTALVAAAFGSARLLPPAEIPIYLLDGAPIALGWLVSQRAPWTPVGPALAWTGAATSCTYAAETWGETYTTPAPWWGADVVNAIAAGLWPWQLVGFAWLMLVFPSGLLPGLRWRLAAWSVPAAAALITVGRAGTPVDQPPGSAWQLAVLVLGLGLLLLALGTAVLSLVVRFRAGDDKTREQLRWVLLAGSSVPVLLAASWWLVSLGVPGSVAYLGFILGMLVLVPAAVTVAVLRHDLFEVDRLIGASVAWLLTSLAAAGVFALVVLFTSTAVGGPSRLGVTGAGFVAALVLLPLHARLHALVGRLLDRERTVLLTQVGRFVDDVREGLADPEAVEQVLRDALGDPALRLLIAVPGGAGAHVTLDGEPIEPHPDQAQVSLRTGSSHVGILLLGSSSRRRMRQAEEAARAARLPIEVSRLRLELGRALTDVQSSRARLTLAGAQERRRIERDLHDGAQQQIVAVGMRLRSVQRQLGPGQPAHRELDAAVEALEATVAELRQLAHGVRPSRLDDGLPSALRSLLRECPLDVALAVDDVEDVELPDVVGDTVYFVVAEGVANALKHAAATHLSVEVRSVGDSLHVQVRDDGVGGAGQGFGLTSLQDRVAALGGELSCVSPVGGSTELTAVIPCAS